MWSGTRSSIDLTKLVARGGMDSLRSPFGRLRRLSALHASAEPPTRGFSEREPISSVLIFQSGTGAFVA